MRLHRASSRPRSTMSTSRASPNWRAASRPAGSARPAISTARCCCLSPMPDASSPAPRSWWTAGNRLDLSEPDAMKFYDCTTAPSPRRVRIFAAEKAITLPTVQVDLRNGEQFSDAYRAINPDCTVPALQLDDGTVIADAVAICQYLEELSPAPPLIGSDAQERAVVSALNRQIERDGFFAA